RGLLPARLRRDRVPGRRGRDARRRQGLLGWARGRPPRLRAAEGRMSITRDWLRGAAAPTTAAPRLGGIDHIEFWVGNARASAAFFASAFGFEIVAYAGPETGVTDRASYVLVQGDIRFVVTAGLTPSSPIAVHVAAHGAGARDV